jgi:hypothetical protein
MLTKQTNANSTNEQYAIGSRVRIIRGVYRHGNLSGTVVGATHCYVDVKVPQLKRQVRVRKTSIEQETEEQREVQLNEVMAREPQIGVALLAVCIQLTKHGIRKGDTGLHRALDAWLDAANDQEFALTKK